ncbi:MFS transporter [Streptomyces physcomitrii]|uniref:MFS transporter n=1 Tax=Streptomyces physcomitrii TaxID=2724184 RepID=UPI0033E050E4
MTTAGQQRLALSVSCAGAMFVALDGTVLIVAQPRLAEDLGASLDQVQWSSTGYLLAVAALLVTAGRLGDRYGHPRLLLLGLLGFGAASAGIALAPGIGWVVGLRCLEGVFGALLQPATLAVLRLSHPPERLGNAVALRTSAIGLAAAAGPLLGGVLAARLGWRAVFLVNVPVAFAVAALTLALRLPEPPRDGRPRLGLGGALLLGAALAGLTHTLVGVPAHGWNSAPTLASSAATALLGALFAGHQRRAAEPFLPSAVLRSRAVAASTALLLLASAALFGTLFTCTFVLQDVLGLDPLGAALRVLPLTALMVLQAPVAAGLVRRYGARATAAGGVLLLALGAGALSRTAADQGWAGSGLAYAALGAGFATVLVTATGTVVGDAPPAHAGVVGGLKQTAMNTGPLLGIALATGTLLLASPAGRALPGADGGASAAGAGATLLLLGAVALLGLAPALLLPARPGRRAGTDPAPGPVPRRQSSGTPSSR